MAKMYVTGEEVLNCHYCQWEIFPGQTVFVDKSCPDFVYDRQECAEAFGK